MRLVKPERKRDWSRLIASVVIASAVGVAAGGPLFGQEVRTLKGHLAPVSSVTFSPDGKRLAALLRNCCSMNQVALYDAETGGRLAITDPVGGVIEAPSHFDARMGESWALGGYGSTGNPCRSVAFTPDGEYVASGDEHGQVKFFDAYGRLSFTLPANLDHRGKFTRRGFEYEGGFAGVVAFVFRPDARTSADSSFAIDDPAVHLPTSYSEPSSTRKRAFQLAAVDLNGAIRILDGQGRTVRGWDAAKHVRRKSRRFPIICLAISPDGSTLASGQTDGQIRLWDVDTGERRAILRGHTGEVETVAFSPDGRLVASGASERPVRAAQQDTQPDPIIRLWDVTSREQIASWEAHPWGVTAVAFSPDAKTLASGGSCDQIKLWDIEKLLSENRTAR